MAVLKFALNIASKGLVSTVSKPQSQKFLLVPTSMSMMNRRYDSSSSKTLRTYKSNPLTKSLTLFSSAGSKLTLDKHSGNIPDAGKATSLKLSTNHDDKHPLVVMLPWLMSKPKHVEKYAKLYLKLGFDVLTVRINPWQLLWPTTGSQIVTKDLLTFLELNSQQRPLLLHGFSVGGYVWGELLSHVEQDKERYSPVMSRIQGHIWDSAADMQDIETGFPIAVFPNNMFLQNTFRKYIRYHMRTFYQTATQHYIRSSQMFHSTMVRSPALFLISHRDPVGNVDSNMRLNESWESLGIKTYIKCWDKSHHVGHFYRYPEEYIAEVAEFLVKIGMLPVACKVRAKL